ncbi:hypothetical protein Hanom_Chr09g00835451 [Helianthus anomalus]
MEEFHNHETLAIIIFPVLIQEENLYTILIFHSYCLTILFPAAATLTTTTAQLRQRSTVQITCDRHHCHSDCVYVKLLCVYEVTNGSYLMIVRCG